MANVEEVEGVWCGKGSVSVCVYVCVVRRIERWTGGCVDGSRDVT